MVNAIGVAVTQLHTDDFEETTEFQPTGSGRYVSFGDLAVGLTMARKMTDRFSVGFTLKYIDETLTELHARNLLIDFGTYYWTGFGSSRFAVAVVNFGTNIAPAGEMMLRNGHKLTHFQKFPPPTIFRIGFATEVIDNEYHKITTSVQLNHPNDNAENVNLGCEYWWHRLVALRGGYRVNMDEESFTFGAGLNLPIRLFELELDLSYSDFGLLGNSTRLTMNLMF